MVAIRASTAQSSGLEGPHEKERPLETPAASARSSVWSCMAVESLFVLLVADSRVSNSWKASGKVHATQMLTRVTGQPTQVVQKFPIWGWTNWEEFTASGSNAAMEQP